MQAIGVYCSASPHVDSVYTDAAREVGITLARYQITMVYGGGAQGMMREAAEGAATHGGRVIGFITEQLKAVEGSDDKIAELHMADSMHMRKQLMFDHSDAFLILPGGFGTLDEVFELITWRYLKLHHKPIVFININTYWDPLLIMIKSIFDQKFSETNDKTLFQFVDSVAEAFQAIDIHD